MQITPWQVAAEVLVQNCFYYEKNGIIKLKSCIKSHLYLDSGYFMKFDTSSGDVGNSALLESRILYPKRDVQCLEFFYRMTGAAGDKLVIWIRADDGTGNVQSLRRIHTITGVLKGKLLVGAHLYTFHSVVIFSYR